MQPFCFSCNRTYSIQKPPFKLHSCCHHLCKPCIIENISCPLDKKPIDKSKFKFDSSEIDFDLLTGCLKETHRKRMAQEDQKSKVDCLFYNTTNNQKEICLLHSKQADLICVNDASLICPNCALFGSHKGHIVQNKESFLKKIASIAQQSLQYYQKLKLKQVSLNQMKSESYSNITLMLRKQQAISEIKEKFKRTMESVRIIEQQCLDQINLLYSSFNDKFIQMIKEGLESTKIDQWCKNVEYVGSLIQKSEDIKSILDGSKFIKDIGSSQDLVKTGQKNLKQIQSLIIKINSYIQKMTPKVKIEFDQTLFDKLNSYCKIEIIKLQNHENQNKMNSTLKNNEIVNNFDIKYGVITQVINQNFQEDQFLLDGGESIVQPLQFNDLGEQNNYSTISTIKPALNQTIYRVSFQTTPRQSLGGRTASHQRLSFENRVSLNHRLPSTSISKNNSIDKRVLRDRTLTDNNQSIESIRKKKIQVPLRYKSLMDELKLDKIDTLDLGGAELGDSGILTICPYIYKTKKLRSVKLIKNKITQQSLYDILKCCVQSRVTSLNLSQNNLTDRAVSIIQSLDLRQLKNVTLSLNKINRRCVKSAIDNLFKKGVTLTV